MFDIQGKVALVTGGASGIGFETARHLLINGAKGVSIADIDLNSGNIALEKLRKEFGKEKVIFVQTDVSDKKSVENFFEQTLNYFKNIDILVNNAGIFKENDYEKQVAVNLMGVLHGTILALKKYIPKYRTGTEGIIINTSSMAGIYSFASAPIYGATKSAVVSLSVSLGNQIHYEKSKIKILTIAPGLTETPIMKQMEFFDETCEFLMKETLEMFELQPAEMVAKSIIKMIKEKPSGTIWMSENNSEPIEFVPEEYQPKK